MSLRVKPISMPAIRFGQDLSAGITDYSTVEKPPAEFVPADVVHLGNRSPQRVVIERLDSNEPPVPTRMGDQYYAYVDSLRFLGRILISSMVGRLPFEWARQFGQRVAIFHAGRPTQVGLIRIKPLGAPEHRQQNNAIADKVMRVNFYTADNVELHGWFVPGDANKPVMLYSHGNDGNMNDRVHALRMFQSKGYPVFLYDYRGYGRSKGYPHEAGLYKDLEAASDFLADPQNGLGVTYGLDQQVAFGESLGGGVSAHVAQYRPFKAVILSATFSSIPDTFENLRKRFWFISWLLPDISSIDQPFASIDKVHRIQSPLMVIHGEEDSLVPIGLSRQLFDRATATPYKHFVAVPGAGHAELYWKKPNSLIAVMDRFLANIG